MWDNGEGHPRSLKQVKKRFSTMPRRDRRDFMPKSTRVRILTSSKLPGKNSLLRGCGKQRVH